MQKADTTMMIHKKIEKEEPEAIMSDET